MVIQYSNHPIIQSSIIPVSTYRFLKILVKPVNNDVIISQFFYARRILNRIIWATSLLFILVLIITISVIYEFETTRFGVILDEKVSVVSEPDSDGTEVFILHEGTKVKINRNLNNWLGISIPDGKIGWLQETSLGVI